MSQEQIHQIFQFLKGDVCALIVLPIAITVATSVVKTCSKDIRNRAIEAADFACGFDLYVAAIVSLLTFVFVLGGRYTSIDPLLSPADIAPIDRANREVVESAVVSAAIAFALALLLIPVVFVHSRVGWRPIGSTTSNEIVYQQTIEAIVVTLALGAGAFTIAIMFIGAH